MKITMLSQNERERVLNTLAMTPFDYDKNKYPKEKAPSEIAEIEFPTEEEAFEFAKETLDSDELEY